MWTLSTINASTVVKMCTTSITCQILLSIQRSKRLRKFQTGISFYSIRRSWYSLGVTQGIFAHLVTETSQIMFCAAYCIGELVGIADLLHLVQLLLSYSFGKYHTKAWHLQDPILVLWKSIPHTWACAFGQFGSSEVIMSFAIPKFDAFMLRAIAILVNRTRWVGNTGIAARRRE